MRLKKRTTIVFIGLGLLLFGRRSQAQPEPEPSAPGEGAKQTDAPAAGDQAPVQVPYSVPPGSTSPTSDEAALPASSSPAPVTDEGDAEGWKEGVPRQQASGRGPPRALDYHKMFTAPTGYFLPAGVVSASVGVDTGGVLTGDASIGLGDVAEFGISTGDVVRVVPCATCDVETSKYYSSAYFKMGIREHLLVKHQPAMALGFQKSFERDKYGRRTRFAKLHLTMSKKLGNKVKAHGGVVFWDAVSRDNDAEFELNSRGVREQLRGFGGLEIQPLPRSQLLLELDWAPEFRLAAMAEDDDIRLRPTFSWGVRYRLASWAVMESGVRIPDIGDINLIDAQIFGQLRILNWRFHDLLRQRD